MPTYEYRCSGCGASFERFQQMTDEPLSRCPACGGDVRRIIGRGAGVISKGVSSRSGDYTGSRTGDSPCCGMTNPCDNPKRCCGE